MGRYSRLNSSYILVSQKQDVEGGAILERDWTTIGERENMRPGKIRVSSDGNFLFTENTEGMAYRKSSGGRWVGSYDYSDVKDVKDVVNSVKLNTFTDNPLAYAYYGSMADKMEGAIVNIIREFPGRIRFGKTKYSPKLSEYEFPDNVCLIENEFEIGFVGTPRNSDKYTNEMRYLPLSWSKYVVSVNGVERRVTDYRVIGKQGDVFSIESVYTGNGELFKYGGRYYKYDKSTGQYIDIDVAESDNYFVRCGEYIRHKDEYYKWNDNGLMYRKLPIGSVCEPKVYELYEVDVICDEEVFKIHIYRQFNKVVFLNESSDDDVEIRPESGVIDEYFSSLTGIEAIMLNRRSNPNYSFDMISCEKDSLGGNVFARRSYSWPSDGYCIRIKGTDFNRFVETVMTSSENYDGAMSDNIWRNMTHESIKNYDWDYERNGGDDRGENIVGSGIVCNVLRLIGMEYDELKSYIDGISSSNRITYDGKMNMPDSEIVTNLVNSGFDTVSTIWHNEMFVPIAAGETIPDNVTVNNYFTLPDTSDVLEDYVSVGCEGSHGGITYYRRTRTIGDDVRLDSIFFDGESVSEKIDPWIRRNSSGYFYRRIMFPPSVVDEYWSDRNTFDEAPTVGSRFSPRYVRVYDGAGFAYYEKGETFGNEAYIHENWYERLDPQYFSQSVADVDFMRRLSLSAKNMFATKGTAHGIDMIMGMFGFGRGETLQTSDYELLEPYSELSPIPADEDFFYYRVLSAQPHGVTYGPNSTFALIPLHATDNDTVYPVDIRVDDGFGGYLYYRKESVNAYDFAYGIYSSLSSYESNGEAFSGYPVSTVYVDGKRYLIPYVSEKKTYEGDLYFQTKGGWCKKSELDNGIYDYSETVPYIKSVNTVSSLLEVDPSTISVGGYVFVKYPLYDSEGFEINPYHVSNYFKLVANDATIPSSWRNVPISGPIEFDNYVPSNDDQFAPTHGDYVNVKFIDSIIFTNEGNNPHKGGGSYDGGEEYLSYMGLPFKYAVDNSDSMFSSYEKLVMAKQFVFAISGRKVDIGKMFVHANEYVYAELSETPNVPVEYWNSLNTFDTIPSTMYVSSPILIRVGNQGDGYSYYEKAKTENGLDKYFLNSKVLIMRNLLGGNLYRRYFKTVMLPYLLQMIPSTTIFVLENFDECDVRNGRFYDISATVSEDSDEGCGTVEGGGKYAECDYAALKAIPGENCHFVEWRLVDCETSSEIETDDDLSSETIRVKVVGDACYEAVFRYDCVLRFSNALKDCDVITPVDGETYGRILYNGEREFNIGTEYVIDEEVHTFFFTAMPNYGYVLDSATPWKIYDSEDNDVTASLVADGYVIISDGRLTVIRKENVCGGRIFPVFSPMLYIVSANVQCECGDSSVTFSDPSYCNPITLTFQCNPNDTQCCGMTYFTVKIGNLPIQNVPLNGTPVVLTIDSGTHVRVEFFNNGECCDADHIVVAETGVTPVTTQSTVYDFTPLHDCVFTGYNEDRSPVLTFSKTCCDFTTNEGFYAGNELVTTVPCGTDIQFKCTHHECIRPVLTVNGVVRTNVPYSGGQTVLSISDVREDVNVDISYDMSQIAPVFDRAVVHEGSNYTQFTEDCYTPSFDFSCPCSTFGLSVDFKDGECGCSCRLEVEKWQYCIGNVWSDIGQNPIPKNIYFGYFLSGGVCKERRVRPVFKKKNISLSVHSNTPLATTGLSVGVTDITNNTTATLTNNQYVVAYNENIDIMVQASFDTTCYRLDSFTASGCNTVTSLGNGVYRLTNLCGNVVLNYDFVQTNNFEVGIEIYDYETSEPTVFNCAGLEVNGTVVGHGYSSVVQCGSYIQFRCLIEQDSCCKIVERVDDVTDTLQTLQPDASGFYHLQNISANHNVRVYVSHETYNVRVVFKNVGCASETDPSGCINIHCVGAVTCSGNVCGYLCDSPVSFTKTKTCDGSVCCDYDFDVITSNGYEYGRYSDFDEVNKVWNAGVVPEVRNNLLSGFGSISEDMVLLVNYTCVTGSSSGFGRITVSPVQFINGNYDEIENDGDCLRYDVFEEHDLGNKCSYTYLLKSYSNDCYGFVKWVEHTSNGDFELSTESEYSVTACDDKEIFAVYEVLPKETHYIECEMIVLEQSMGQFNPAMHDSMYASSLLYDKQMGQGSCGSPITFRFDNTHPDLFSMQGLYYLDTFDMTWKLCTDYGVEMINDGNYERYVVEFTSCSTARYRIVLVPNDYITFYNPDYLNTHKSVSFSLGYYDGSDALVNVTTISGYQNYIPLVYYWNGSAWTSVSYNSTTKVFSCSSADNFLHVRIDTPSIQLNKIGNYVMDTANNTMYSGRCVVKVGNTNIYGVSGSILSIAFGENGNVATALPSFFAKCFFKNTPSFIYGYAFKFVSDVGENSMHDMFSVVSGQTISDNVETDFLMLDNIRTVGENGCYYLFAKTTLSGFSMENIVSIGKHGCEGMFKQANQIRQNIVLNNLSTVDESGCVDMFFEADGYSMYVTEPSTTFSIEMKSLTTVGKTSFKQAFLGLKNAYYSVTIGGSTPISYSPAPQQPSSVQTFSSAFKETNVVAVYMAAIVLNANLLNYMEQCFNNCSLLEKVTVGTTFDFVYSVTSNTNPTYFWLGSAGREVSNPVFKCSNNCRANVEDASHVTLRNSSTTVPNGWTITAY